MYCFNGKVKAERIPSRFDEELTFRNEEERIWLTGERLVDYPIQLSSRPEIDIVRIRQYPMQAFDSRACLQPRWSRGNFVF